MYGTIVGQSKTIDDLFFKLNLKLKKEIHFQEEMEKLLGSLDMLITSASMRNASISEKSSVGLEKK